MIAFDGNSQPYCIAMLLSLNDYHICVLSSNDMLNDNNY